MSIVNIKMKNGINCDTYVTSIKSSSSTSKVLLKPVILLMDGIGHRKCLFEIADRIANEGYFVLVPNLYYRQGVGTSLIKNIDDLKSEKTIGNILCQTKILVEKTNLDDAINDICQLFEYIDNYGDVGGDEQNDSGDEKQKNNNKIRKSIKGVGLIGYCFGGGLAIRVGANSPNIIKAIATFHAGRLAIPDDPKSVLYQLNKLKANCCYFGHAEFDDLISHEQIKLFESYLNHSNINYKSEIYYGCKHGFTLKDISFVFNQNAYEKHFKEIFNLFKNNL